jgi:hypothetical protein
MKFNLSMTEVKARPELCKAVKTTLALGTRGTPTHASREFIVTVRFVVGLSVDHLGY